MNYQLLHTTILSAALGLLTACGNEQEQTSAESGQGFLVSLSDEVGIATRTTPADLGVPVASQFNLQIQRQATGKDIYNGTFTDKMINVAVGTYTLTATHGEDVSLALDAPFYKGSIEAEVTSGTATHVTIPCAVANSLISVNYTNPELFQQIYSSYGVMVQVGNRTTIIPGNDTQSAYFPANASEVSATFIAQTLEGSVVEHPLEELATVLPLQAADHAILRLSANNTGLNVTRVEVKQETVSETIPDAWLPKPKVTGFNGNTSLTFVESEEAPANPQINITCAKPFQEIEFTLNLEDERYTALNKTYLLSAITSEERAAIEAIGIALPAMDGTAQNATIDPSSFYINQQTNGDGIEVTNQIAIRVKANERWSSEDPATYTIQVKKPEFSISIQPGNMWSKEFTADEISVTSGNLDNLKKKLIYQYSADGGNTWQAFSNDRLQQFSVIPDNKAYKIRAIYRDCITSNIADATLETPVQLPNSDMNSWKDEVYKSSYYCFYPWSDSDQDADVWDTNNLYTTRHRNNGTVFWVPTIAEYNGFHAVSYAPGRTGLAAELRNTANGRGNMVATDRDYNKVAGVLYLGESSLTMGTSGGAGDSDGSKDVLTMNKGLAHNARPTALKFWHKYAPCDSDTWTAHIDLLDSTGQVINSKDYSASGSVTDWAEVTLDLPYTDGVYYEKAASINIEFRSTNHEGSGMHYVEQPYTFYYNQGLNTKSYSGALCGSVLHIDDISLVYDK